MSTGAGSRGGAVLPRLPSVLGADAPGVAAADLPPAARRRGGLQQPQGHARPQQLRPHQG